MAHESTDERQIEARITRLSKKPFTMPVLIWASGRRAVLRRDANITPGRVVGHQVIARKRWRLRLVPPKGVHVNEDNFHLPPPCHIAHRVVLVAANDMQGRPIVRTALRSGDGLTKLALDHPLSTILRVTPSVSAAAPVQLTQPGIT
jgi:hypothetical protein